MKYLFFYIFSIFLLLSNAVEAKVLYKKLQRSERREVEVVENMIKSLPDSKRVTFKDTTLVESTYYLFSDLSEKQQNHLSNEYIHKIYANIYNLDQLFKAKEINSSIVSLPNKLQLQDSVLVNAIGYQYDSLGDYGKSYVTITNLTKLYNAENKILLLDSISEFCAFLSAIPYMVTYDDAKDISNARDLYNSLSSEAQELVPSYLYRRLLVAEQRLKSTFEFVNDLDSTTLDISVANICNMITVNDEYNALSDNVKDIVSAKYKDKLCVIDSLVRTYAEFVQYRIDFTKLIEKYNFKVEFKYSEVVFAPNGIQCMAIDAITKFLNENPNYKLVITGNADDDVVSKMVGLDIAYERAMSVYGQFLIYGANKEQLIVKSQLTPSNALENDSLSDKVYTVDFEIQSEDDDIVNLSNLSD